ncbi:protein LLP homolog isoform X1 [Varroa destructor]|uniref:Uncharacterized protein n=1 Tax=Varroa destructor TaxID=109461 RepID=A0A7M7J7W5_VARDE|nr:protein LLP homolog isoform X1 [Varroa destructor]
MAKSIRSQRGKKMRAIKRVRYAQKQLKQLKETVAKTVNHVTVGSMDIDSARAEVADYIEWKKKQVAEKLQKQEESAMDLDEVPEFSMKTMRNRSGDYPKWMGQKQIRKQKYKKDKSRRSNGRKKGW